MPRPKTYCEASPLVGSAGQDICRAFRQSTYPSRYSFIEWVKVLIDNINSRFHSVDASKLDYRNSIQSIEAFESIVALNINRATCIAGHSVTNGGQSVSPQEYRFKDFEAKLWFLLCALKKLDLGKSSRTGQACQSLKTPAAPEVLPLTIDCQ